MEKLNYVEIIRQMLGKENYLELLTKISTKVDKNSINLVDYFNGVFDKYCLIILLLGTSKRVDIDMYKIKIDNSSINLNANEIISEYGRYIKIIEDKRFEIIKTII